MAPMLANRLSPVNATDTARVGVEQTAGFRFARWTAVRRGALAAYFIVLVAWSAW